MQAAMQRAAKGAETMANMIRAVQSRSDRMDSAELKRILSVMVQLLHCKRGRWPCLLAKDETPQASDCALTQ